MGYLRQYQKPNLLRTLLCVGWLLTGLACTDQRDSDKFYARRAVAENPAAAQMKSTISQMVTLDEKGEIKALAGYEAAAEASTSSSLKVDQLADPALQNKEIFTFQAPKGYTATYGASLSSPTDDTTSTITHNIDSMPNNTSSGTAAPLPTTSYSSAPPTFGTLYELAKASGQCGDLAINLYLRLAPDNNNQLSSVLRMPPLIFNLPCAQETFAGLSLTIADGATTTKTASVDLHIAASPHVTHMYLSATADCGAGGSWEGIAPKKLGWVLTALEGNNTVSLKARDVVERESSCISASIVHDTRAPTSPSISINAGATYANATGVTLTLAATEASAMYVTNVPDCASGGAWDAYASSKSWTLAQTNATASVYVKFKDTAGNESACVSDSIIHDGLAPSASSLLISSNAAYTTSSTVTLSLASTEATEMYITNTAGCGSGGAWAPYATAQPAWGLGQTNATATVFAKFRDAALNESACVSDTIIHDTIVPSAPTGFSDGTTTAVNTSSPSLSWGASTDSGSGLAGYEIAIGSAAGLSDIKSWASVGNITSASVGSLNLTDGATYYASVRAVDQAGNYSSEVAGDGFTHWTLWTQQAFIKASNAKVSNRFGEVIAMDGTTMIVGSHYENSNQTVITNGTTASTDNSATTSGAVWVYTRAGTNWTQQAFIKAVNANPGDQFGRKLSISGDTLAAAAHAEQSNETTITNGATASTNNSYTEGGAVYVYKRTGTTWSQEAYLKPDNLDDGDQFGNDVFIDGNTLVTSAITEDSNQSTISATGSPNNTLNNSGAVYVFTRSATTWSQQAYIKSDNIDGGDDFGVSVAVKGETLVATARYEDSAQTTVTNGPTASTDDTQSASGAAYVYKRTATAWAQEAYLKASNAGANDIFGARMAFDGDTVIVGAISEDSNVTTITNGSGSSTDDSNADAGAAYIYKRTATSWAQEAYLKAANNSDSDNFGYRVAISGDFAAVSAYKEGSNATTVTNGTTASSDTSAADAGAVYVYKRTGSLWQQRAYVKASNSGASDNFGIGLALYGDTLMVGAPMEDSNQTTITHGTGSTTNNGLSDSGAVYIYTK